MRLADFDFDLPPDCIAQHPVRPRDAARLLHVGCELSDRSVRDLPELLRPGDVLVVNNTRVIPAQFTARRGDARIGITLDQPRRDGSWHALARNARRLHVGDVLRFNSSDSLRATVLAREADGGVTLAFNEQGTAMRDAGVLALPPYIDRPAGPLPQDSDDYQTMFAAHEGAVAAPTAGLHFTPALLAALEARGVQRVTITLHVGAGTFLPVRIDDVSRHHMHAERGEITAEAAAAINAARRVVAVGTTCLRLLETAADDNGMVRAFSGDTSLFILPGYRFHAVDVLMTNFHLPRSTLFMLVCAFAGTGRMRAAYAHAIEAGYRFYSYGDACLLELTIAPPPARGGGRVLMALMHAIIATDGAARAGVLHTAHGDVATPGFMPVGTAGTVKAMTADAVRATGADIVLGNTYHLMLRPGAERVARLGGLHRFMDWPGPILTDSGGFQVMSLAKLRKLDDDGVTFQSHLDGSTHRLTPRRSIEIQHLLDATITMVLDECTSFPATTEEARVSMQLSIRWAQLSREAFVTRPGYGLFGIVQGSVYPDLRAECAHALTAIGFDGYAIGGLAIGEGQATTFAMLEASVPQLPVDAPRYLMGVGTPGDIIGAVQRGVDMFDCVIPTRAGRTARGYTSEGVLNLRNARFADDAAPLDSVCGCPACTRHSRAYLHHLFKAEEMLGPMLLTWHNVQYYQDLMRGLRAAIAQHRLDAHVAAVRAGWAREEPA